LNTEIYSFDKILNFSNNGDFKDVLARSSYGNRKGRLEPLPEIFREASNRSGYSTLIQIFSNQGKSEFTLISRFFAETFPRATVIGSTTDGVIYDGTVDETSVAVSITYFKSTSLKSAMSSQESSFENGKTVAENSIQKNTKLVLLFSDGLKTNGEELLKGFSSVNSEIPIAGGMAADSGKFIETFISLNGKVLKEGVVAVSLNSETLQVHTNYNFNWQPIGKKMRVTKAYKNRVYTIDNIEAAKIYSKYLGEDIYEELPSTGAEFPLIINRNGVNVARAVLSIDREDESLGFAGNLKVGDKVQFGIGNISMIFEDSIINSKSYLKRGIETIFIYSCMARRRLMPNDIGEEITPFAKIAPTVGFFTYGEFFHKDGHNELLNQSLTSIALSENINDKLDDNREFTEEYRDKSSFRTLKALSHLINASTSELKNTQKMLLDSMHYASTIQKSLLPKDKILKEFFSDYFIYYKPRDKVGGDIYSFHKYSEDVAMLFIIDCVGHGVYGALITMVVKAIENSLVSSKVISPKEILERFNREIRNIFIGEIDVGFDGAVIYIDRRRKLIKFAGASTSLFIINDGVISEIKGDRYSVGNRFSKRHFQFNEYIQRYDNNTEFYVSTDGYLDQVGQSQNYSFGKNRFKKLLADLHISTKKFALKRRAIRRKLREYQGKKPTLDDRTVIGFKL